ncbi:MAG TPA: class A beta-lactamase-related serine hydrolase [Candidatus Agrococcus pullicola]|uniref:Class A beta-lactamase-related serine hydrolase n=1 Tax=Candidatus Agrococcus pullicola TaxID=2838429 RepID=A0A9D1YWR5_9MICO|nr:class A beta-lactamase-related serine hydrolase [Candidatus Agrococcus pullicola]
MSNDAKPTAPALTRPPVHDQHGGLVTSYSDGVPSISYALVDEHGDVLQQSDAERVYYSASTVKIGVLVAALRQVQRGVWGLDDELTVTHEFASITPGAGRFVMEPGSTDPGLGSPGDVVSRARVLERMMTVSANCATNMLFEDLGHDRVSAAFTDVDIYDTCMDRPYSDLAGLEAGVTNRASALGLARFVAALARGELLDKEHTDYAKRLMIRREEPVIASVTERLDTGSGTVTVGSKGGSVSGIVHDVAFIEHAGETRCLAICSSGFTNGQGEAVIRAVTSAILGL